MLKEKKKQKKRSDINTRGIQEIAILQDQLKNPNQKLKKQISPERGSILQKNSLLSTQQFNQDQYPNNIEIMRRSSISPLKSKCIQSSQIQVSSQNVTDGTSLSKRKSVFMRLVNSCNQEKAQFDGDFTIDANRIEQNEQGEQFHSKIGKALFLAMQQSKGDKESFRKLAQNTLRDYNKSKANLFKQKKFPPNLPKFTQEDNLYLNSFMPDFQNPLYIGNKNDPFEEIKEFQPDPNSNEGEILSAIEKISQGKLMSLWKQYQIF